MVVTCAVWFFVGSPPRVEQAILQMDRVRLGVVLHEPLAIDAAKGREEAREDGACDADGGGARCVGGFTCRCADL